MTCPSCGAANAPGKRFCTECGTPLAQACANCGAPLTGDEKFCGDCGTPLAAASTGSPAATQGPVAERRLVSVLFADLVGFTARSQDDDPEDVRNLLSRYFDLCRTIIDRYGGTVEKFIGDAVMAVWGTPVAQEDDAERAVRAALDLVAAVPDLDERFRARAGVLTGEAAVTLGAAGQGMVAGDLVNTASRIQAEAEAGTVLVGETTRRAAEAAIALEPAGERDVKGKTEPLAVFRALRVTAARGGAQKTAGLEPPFVGREREFRHVKELLHASADEGRAQLVSVVGIAGIGKSRLAWELEKYIDGLTELFWWHRGRCLAYGEGVTYWALAEMVRMRAGIAEGEAPEGARAKLAATVAEHVPDEDERAWIEPRLGQLLGLDDRQAHEREELFAGWRLFLERLADGGPVVMVFEDMQWADTSLLDFVEYLLEWSRNHPIFVLTHGRPELTERHPQWGAGKRNFTSLTLEPLQAGAMDELLAGLVPGLPAELRGQIRARAEGVPLYAVETVRMLLDRGLLERDGDVYRPTAAVDRLDVPETLHALLAARLDALEPEERRLVQDASVLGKTFTRSALAALSGRPETDLEPLLAALLRKEVLSRQADPRSPERGQYAFVQDLLKRVAYETLARPERKARHLAAAAHLEEAFGPAEQEVVEVIAAHYVGAYEVAPSDADAPAIRARACEGLTRAGERAAALAASDEAARYFGQAAGLTDDAVQVATLRERAGEAALAAGRIDEATAQFEHAIRLLEEVGETHPAARVAARLGEVDWRAGRLEEGIARMERAYGVLAGDEPDEDFAALTAQLGRIYTFTDDTARASELLEEALTLAEVLALPEILSHVMNSAGVVAALRSRLETAEALFVHSLKVALEHDLPTAALRAYNNVADNLAQRDRYDEALAHHERGIALARRVGNRFWEWTLQAEMASVLRYAGRWAESRTAFAEIPADAVEDAAPDTPLVEIDVQSENVEAAREHFAPLVRHAGDEDVQRRMASVVNSAILALGEGDAAGALEACTKAFGAIRVLGPTHAVVKQAFTYGVEAAIALGDRDAAARLLDWAARLRPGELAPSVRAQAARFRARLSTDATEVEREFRAAISTLRELGARFWLAVALLEHAEWLVREGRGDEAEPLVAEARETFADLGAAPWLERAERLQPVRVPEPAEPRGVSGRT